MIVIATASLAAPLTFPPLTGRVVDDAHILSDGTVQTLTDVLAAHERKTTQQIVVVTLPGLQGHEIEDYGYQLGRAWGIGQKGKDNGALLIVAPAEHKARIEVGYGLEGDLTDAQSAQIVQSIMLPRFRTGDYDGGVLAGTKAILTTLGDPQDSAQSAPPVQSYSAADDRQDGNDNHAFMLFFVAFLILYFISRRAGRGGRGGFAPIILGGMLGGGGFGGGSGGFGGGGFGGGGGSFGGGGASGSW